jgi:hypothetical protein
MATDQELTASINPLMNRKGRFFINLDLILESPEIAQRIMGEVIIIQADFDWASQRTEYSAVSEHFEPIAPGMKPPLYDAEVTGEDEVRFSK